MRIGVTGHQAREGIDWGWTGRQLRSFIAMLSGPVEGWSSLAVGADQLFAEIVLARGGGLVTVVPGPWYPDCYAPADRLVYRRLLAQGHVVMLDGYPEGEAAFLAAGKAVARHSDHLVAIWDGEAAAGKGGTGDIVAYALALGCPVTHLDPIRRRRRALAARRSD